LITTRPDGTEEIKVEKRKPDVNIVKTLTGAHFSEEYKEMTDSELKHFKGVYELLYEEELGIRLCYRTRHLYIQLS
jgi:hypothetical protein